MTNVQLNVSDDLEVERLAKEAGFENAGAYVEALVRNDRRRRAEEWMAFEIQRGLESGPSREISSDDVELMQAEYDRRMLARRTGDRAE